MVCDLAALGGAEDAADPPVAEVGDDPGAFVDWFAVFAAAFEIPPDLARPLAPVIRTAGLPGGPLRHVVLRDAGSGEVRACGSLALAAGAAGLGNIAVAAEHRGRGLGRAITRALLREARAAGCEKAVLSATPEAAPLYAGLGFTQTGPRWIYVPPR
jgi:GNAT superfamily N-acetyltransferase